MKKIIISLIVVVIIAASAVSWMILENLNISRIIQESDKRLADKEKEIKTLKTEVGQKVYKIQRIEAEKKEIKRRFKETSRKSRKKPAKYDKQEYDKLLSLALSMQLDFKKYLALDQVDHKLSQQLIEDFSAIDGLRIKQLAGLKQDRDHIAAIKTRWWAVVAGPSLNFSPRGISLGIGITAGIKIF